MARRRGSDFGYVGFYRGVDSRVADARLQGMSNEGRTREAPAPPELAVVATLPASVYHGPAAVNQSADKVAMLDGTPVSRISAGSRSPRFRDHLVEMDNTSSFHPYSQPQPSIPSPAVTRIMTPTTDSPTLGRQTDLPRPKHTSLPDGLRRKQHFMAWNDYDAGHVSRGNDDLEVHEMEATMMPKSPPATARIAANVSPDTEPGPSDGRVNVSPFGSLDKGARSLDILDG